MLVFFLIRISDKELIVVHLFIHLCIYFGFDCNLGGMNLVVTWAADNFCSVENGTGPDLGWNHPR